MAKLATTVVLTNEEDGVTYTFGPDDDLPKWAAAKITNKKAYAEGGPGVGEEGGAAVPGPGQVVGEEPAETATKKSKAKAED